MSSTKLNSKKASDSILATLKSENEALKVKLVKKRDSLSDTTLDVYSSSVHSIMDISFKVRKNFKGHMSKVYACHWAPEKPYLVSASQDGKLYIWNTLTTNKVAAIPLRSAWVMTCAYSPSGEYVASGGLDNICTVYPVNYSHPFSSFPKESVNRKSENIELIGHTGFISCCRFVSDQQIISSSGDMSILLWDISMGKAIGKFEGHDADVMSIALNKDKNLLVSGSCDAYVKLWDLRCSKCVTTFSGHQADVNSVQFFPDGYAVISGSDDGSCRLFDLRYHGQINKFDVGGLVGGVTCLDVSLSGRLLLVGYEDSNFFVWDTLKAERISLSNIHLNRVSTVSVAPDGSAFVTGSWDHSLKLWTKYI